MCKKDLEIMIKERFEMVVKKLQANDRNSTYDEVLEDLEYDYIEATKYLKSHLEQNIEEFDNMYDEECEFYKECLKMLNGVRA